MQIKAKKHSVTQKNGLLASHTGSTGLTTRYVYDGLDRIKTKSYEINQQYLTQETFEYQGSHLVKWSDQEQHTTEYNSAFSAYEVLKSDTFAQIFFHLSQGSSLRSTHPMSRPIPIAELSLVVALKAPL